MLQPDVFHTGLAPGLLSAVRSVGPRSRALVGSGAVERDSMNMIISRGDQEIQLVEPQLITADF
jgi:hypothetical protein